MQTRKDIIEAIKLAKANKKDAFHRKSHAIAEKAKALTDYKAADEALKSAQAALTRFDAGEGR